jgi:hypothetical protein
MNPLVSSRRLATSQRPSRPLVFNFTSSCPPSASGALEPSPRPAILPSLAVARGTMSHALLLRLFLSPYFSVHVAIQYLKAYPANIGITHYLTNRLRSMPSREVEFYWPELW